MVAQRGIRGIKIMPNTENIEEAGRISEEGFNYLVGRGVPQDRERAKALFRQAAAMGEANAAFNLSQMLAEAEDPATYQELASLSTYVAENHDDATAVNIAENRLYLMYLNGWGVRQDLNTALAWLERAADHGNELSQSTLGIRYANGDGVIQDSQKALKYMQMAANNGSAEACFNLGQVYNFGNLGVQKNPARAVDYYRIASEKGIGAAMAPLADIMLNGAEGVEPDEAYAVLLIRKLAARGNENAIGYLRNHGVTDLDANMETVNVIEAAEHGDPEAMHEVGRYFMDGEILPEHNGHAMEWLAKAAEKGHAEAKVRLAIYYEYDPEHLNPAYAMQLLQEALAQGEVYANYEIGKMYHEGNGVPQDDNMAMTHLHAAMEVGFADAPYLISQIVTDPNAKLSWLRKAAEMGSEDAARELSAAQPQPRPKKKGFFGLFS